MVKGIEAKLSYTQGGNFYMDLMKEKFHWCKTTRMNMNMSMMTLVHNYENEDEYIEDMFRQEEQFISYSDRIIKIWKLKIWARTTLKFGNWRFDPEFS